LPSIKPDRVAHCLIRKTFSLPRPVRSIKPSRLSASPLSSEAV
jgi:hypothetical protein